MYHGTCANSVMKIAKNGRFETVVEPVSSLPHSFLKRLVFAVFVLPAVFVIFTADITGQKSKTIILIRHAEKDVSATADPNDPSLAPEGKQRAERLWKAVKRYRPGALYSTDYRRTRETLSLVAAKRGLQIKLYDPRKPETLIAELNGSPVKRVLVTGHSNTIPALANLLMKKDVFKQLDDTEHSVIYVIRLRNGALRRTEVFTY